MSSKSFDVAPAIAQQVLVQSAAKSQQTQQLIRDVSLQIIQERTLSEILSAVAAGSRELLDCDRAVVYQFEPDLSGTIVAESVLPEWNKSLWAHIEDDCVEATGLEKYEQGRTCVLSDINDSDTYSECHLNMLKRFEVQASIVVPVLVERVRSHYAFAPSKVWGLLIVHSCGAPRVWQQHEVRLLQDLAGQIAIAICLAELISQLKARNQDLSELTRAVSQDLKVPLRAINNLTLWLGEDIADIIPPESRGHLMLLQSRVKQADRLIDDLVSYSLVDSAEQDAVWVSPQVLIHEVVKSLAPPSSFEVVVSASSVPKIHTRKRLLQQVLRHLIDNAVRHHNRLDGKVTVTAEAKGELIVFSVTDDGPGIEPDYQSSIFTLFRTFLSSDDTENTGVGLSLAKKVIERHGGEIVVCSAPEKGSTFTFTWPKHY